MTSLVDLLLARAEREPEREIYRYLRDGEELAASLSLGQLHSRAASVGRWLLARGCADNPVLLAFPAGLEFIAAFFGCLYAGAIAVPIDPAISRREDRRLQFIVRDSGARMLLTGSSRPLRAAPPGVTVIPLNGIQGHEHEEQTVVPARNHLAYIQYTSGSTQEARGVMVSHANVLSNLEEIDRGFSHDSDSVSVTWLPHFHDMGLVYGLLQPLYGSFQCVLMSPGAFIQRPARWLKAVSTFEATHSGGPNFAYDLCSRAIDLESLGSLRLDSWRVAFNGAEPIQADTLRSFASFFAPFGFRSSSFYPAYGLAENTLKVSGPRSAGHFSSRLFDSTALARNEAVEVGESSGTGKWLVGCGLPDRSTQVAIVDPDTRNERPEGQIGEVWVSGPSVADGYWRRPDETAEIFSATIAGSGQNPYLRTGDLGFLYEGELFIAGRLKDMIIVRGLNYYPQDMEVTAADAHPSLRRDRAAAFSIGSQGTEALVVVLEIATDLTTESETIADSVRRSIALEHSLAVHKVAFLRPGTLPRTSSGKVRRRHCRELLLSDRLEIIAISEVPSDLPLQTTVAPDRSTIAEMDPVHRRQLILEYLSGLLATIGVPGSSIDLSLSAVANGIDSLVAAALSSRIKSELGVKLTPSDLLSDASLGEIGTKIADEIDDARGSPPDSPIPSTTDGLQPCSFEQERLWWLDQLVPGYVAHTLVVAIRFSGPLDETQLRVSLLDTILRHQPLHTRFVEVNGVPWQMNDVTDPLDWSVSDLSHGNPLYPNAVADTVFHQARKPFRLDSGPLLRVTLLRFSDTSRVMVLTVHHSVADGYSIGLLMRETLARYHAIASGTPPDVPILPYRYSDFTRWWRDQLDQDQLRKSYDYWVRNLAGLHTSDSILPYDRARPDTPPLASSQRVFLIETDLHQLLRQFSFDADVTLFMTLATCFIALLHRYSGEEDIVIGIPTSGRPRQELYNLIGQFAYPLVLRVKVHSSMSFSQLMAYVKSNALEAYEHGNLPFLKVIEAAGRQGLSGFNSLFRAMIGLMKDPISSIASTEVSIELEDIPFANSDADIFLTLLENAAGVKGLLVYNEQIFDSSTIREFIDSFLLVMRHGISQPNTAVSELPISPALERRSRARQPVRTLAVAANFTAEPIEECLQFWGHRLGRQSVVRFAPYNQVFQQLLDPQSLFAANEVGANIALIRLEDWQIAESDGCRPANRKATARDFCEALRSATERFTVPLVVCLLSGGGDFSEEIAIIAETTRTLRNAHLLTTAEVEENYPVERVYDPHANNVAHIPWTTDYYIAVGTAIVRKLTALDRKPIKAIAIDCDNTLWTGICGEVGPEAVAITEARIFLQQFLLRKRSEGLLLCLCSKNNPDDVSAVFERGEMLVRPEHFSAQRINWLRKSENLRALAEDLNIGVDSIVMIDDDPRECAEIKANCPGVVVAELPSSEARILDFLRHQWMLDAGAALTMEDTKRAEFYRHETERKKELARHPTLDDYLSGLNITISVEDLEPQLFHRVAQLIQRTNQFNLTASCKSGQEIVLGYAAGTLLGIAVTVADRFGDYGLVGAALYHWSSNSLSVDIFVLSCRAMGRRVEHHMIAWLAEAARKAGLDIIDLPLRRTAKNRPAADFLESLGSDFAIRSEGETIYRIPAAVALAAPRARSVEASAPPSSQMSAAQENRPLTLSFEPSAVLNQLDSVCRIRAAIGMRVQSPGEDSSVSRPRTETERIVAEIWTEVLGITKPSIYQDFFRSGGESLRASRVVASIRQQFAVEFPLSFFFTGNPTIIDISREIERLELACLDESEREEVLAEINASFAAPLTSALVSGTADQPDYSTPQEQT